MDVTLEVEGRLHDLSLVRTATGWTVDVNGTPVPARLQRNGSGAVILLGERAFHVELGAPGRARIDGKLVTYQVQAVTGTAVAGAAGAGHTVHVRPPMNGKLERILVQAGQSVAKGDVLFVLEAMKMHNEVKAPAAGKVTAIHLAVGATVEPRQAVLDLAT